MMETIITEKAAIYVVNVSVSASSVSFVVDNLALDRDGSVRLHAIKIINQVFNFIKKVDITLNLFISFNKNLHPIDLTSIIYISTL